MLISCDYSMVNNPLLFGITGSSAFCAYPEDYRAPIFDYNVFAKEFVWETLLKDNMTTCGEMMMIVNNLLLSAFATYAWRLSKYVANSSLISRVKNT
ncbi:hypothetical protein BRARA_D02840 [Brassica rapa]|nr:hypothetical protein BRARA_D02840 [Brassica rapa]VDD25202.1 unnamed protein product [Brassica rapa]